MEPFDTLIKTLEIIDSAMRAQDKEKGFEAVTVLLVQFMQSFGHDSGLVRKTLPVLQQLKDHIQSGNFEDADLLALALEARLKQASEAMAAANQVHVGK